MNVGRRGRIAALVVSLALVAGACGSGDEAESATDDDAAAVPTQEAVVEVTPTPLVLPTSVPEAVEPTATPIPEPTATPLPEPTATTTPTPQRALLVGCFIDPSEPIAVGDPVRVSAVADPADTPVTYMIDFGDGSVIESQVSDWVYTAPGNYDVVVRYTHADGSGEALCGTAVVGRAFGDGPVLVDPAVEQYIGLTVTEAGELAVRNGFVFRIASDDGEIFPGTADFRPDRLNFDIVDGIVIGALVN